MRKSLEAVLDECLNRIEAGREEDLAVCVAEHPAEAGELEPLLRLAVELGALREDQPPSPVALQAAKHTLLREAARLKGMEEEKARARRFPLWLNLQPLMRRSAAVVALAALLVVTLLGGGTIAASANSLPGDTLYSVKPMTEQFQLVLTLDRQAKAQLVQKLDERRREEAKAIVTSHRVADMSFRGRVEGMDGSRWIIGGVALSTSAETALEGDILVGTMVRVQVRSMSDGTLWATRVSVEPEPVVPQPIPSPTPEPTETPTEMPPTQVPTEVPTEVPTRVEIPPTAAPVEVPPPTPTPSQTPTSTPSQTPTPRPTATRTATATAIPPTPTPPREIKVRFIGLIEAISASAWTVGGQQVRVNTSTRIDEGQARATVCARAAVVAVRQEDETLLAIEITVEGAAPTPEQPSEYRGLIERWSATQWVVGGNAFIVNADTVIAGSPQKGLLAEVKALRQCDGSLLAKHILIRLPTAEVQFEGFVQSISPAEWIVEGVTVRIDGQTVIVGTPAVGCWAEVQGLSLPDEAVLGRRIVVQPLPQTPTTSPEPTPTIQPS